MAGSTSLTGAIQASPGPDVIGLAPRHWNADGVKWASRRQLSFPLNAPSALADHCQLPTSNSQSPTPNSQSRGARESGVTVGGIWLDRTDFTQLPRSTLLWELDFGSWALGVGGWALIRVYTRLAGAPEAAAAGADTRGFGAGAGVGVGRAAPASDRSLGAGRHRNRKNGMWH